MKRFLSRYDKVRRVREQQERLAKAEAALRNAEMEAAGVAESQARQRLDDVSRSTATQMDSGVNGAVLTVLLNSVTSAEAQVVRATEFRRRTEELAEVAMKQYGAARAELRTLDEVIHREKLEHQQQQLKHEELQLQEQASRTWYQTVQSAVPNTVQNSEFPE